ncbi:unnamed protein product [Choristocarpus tenellus]
MKRYSNSLVLLMCLFIVYPSYARYGQGGSRGKRGREDALNNPSDKDLKSMEASAWKAALSEMGDENEDELLRRVEELKKERMDELFPKAYIPKAKQYVEINKDDIWENGTVVRWMAKVIAIFLAFLGLYAFKDQIMGKEPPRRRGGEKYS